MKVAPIGRIHTPFQTTAETPIQPVRSQAVGKVEIFEQYAEGLSDTEGFSHLILLYHFHKSSGHRLMVEPFLDDRPRGVFATRYPARPNQIGLSVVKLLGRTGNILSVEGIDVLDGTPLLDIKPYIPDFQPQGDVRIGWLEDKIAPPLLPPAESGPAQKRQAVSPPDSAPR